MIVKERNHNFFNNSIKRFLNKHFVLSRVVISLIGFFILVAIAFGSMYYGMKVYQTGAASSINYRIHELAVTKLGFIPNYFQGILSKTDEFIIDIKFKDLEKIRYHRNRSLNTSHVTAEAKDDDVPAKLTYKGKTYKIKISLTGFTLMHIGDSEKWSYRIKLKNDASIMGMKEFNLLYPSSRGYLSDWIGHRIQEKIGLIALRIDYVNVTINGNDLGLYCLEESFDKILIENNKFKEGIVFRWGKTLKIYNSGKILEDPEFRKKSIALKSLYKNFNIDKIGIDQLFDLPKMAKSFAVNDLLNGARHGIDLSNTRFYFNPITNLIEPIGREWIPIAYKKRDRLDEMALSVEYMKNFSPFYNKFFSDSLFMKLYIKELEMISNPTFLDNLFDEISVEMKIISNKIYRDNPFYVYPKEFLYSNQKYIQSKIYPDDPIVAYFNEGSNENFKILIRNLQHFPVRIKSIILNDSIILQPLKNSTIIEESMNDYKYEQFEFSFPENMDLSSASDKFEISYHLPGIDSSYIEEAFPWPYNEDYSYSYNSTKQKPNYQDFKYLTLDKINKNIVFDNSEIILDKNLIIPDGYKVIVSEGTKINMINSASIISYSPIRFNGSEESPVVITSSDSTGQGIFVLNTEQRSILNYVSFEYLRNPSKNGWELSGSLTFYEADVTINHCIFSNNQRGDDYLNIVRSKFDISNSVFINNLADAFDSDFCTGSIFNTTFINCGNDAIDISGTNLTIENVFIDNIGDKGLSAGENSQMNVDNVRIINSEIAICSKDMSQILISNVNLENDKICFAAFQKKSEFGPGIINVSKLEMSEITLPYLIEKNSSLTIDDKIKESDNERVKDVLYGVKYGKSSE